MSSFPYTCGIAEDSIGNKAIMEFETAKASDIVIALDKSNIPFSARFGDAGIMLTYDSNFQKEVDEIIAKVSSGVYETLLRGIKENKNDNGYLILLSEVADVLHVSIGTLKIRPLLIQEALCKTYVDFWLCDTYTLQRELGRIITVNGRTYSDMEEHERSDYQANHTPEKRKPTELDDIAQQMNAIKNAEDYRKRANQTTIETERTVYITREMRRRNAEEHRRKQAERSMTSQHDDRERMKRP